MKLVDELPKTKFDTLKQKLLAHYGKNPYYEMRKGTRLISPEDQERITSIVKNIAPDRTNIFDKYLEQEVWT